MRMLRLVIILVMLALPCRSLFCQTSTKLQVGHDTWTFKEGAPTNVEALAQTTSAARFDRLKRSVIAETNRQRWQNLNQLSV